MTREEIMQDIKFREACGKYGIYWRNCDVYKDFIVLNSLNTPITDLYVLMDKNYNTFCIDKLNSEFEDLEDFITEKYEVYCNFTDVVPFGENFGYPFEEFTLKNIIDLASRIEVMETNHGHSLSTQINGEWYKRDEEELEDYFKLLSYIKFLGEEIKQYFLLSYHMQAMGFEVPDVYAYVRQLISKVNERVDNCLIHYRRLYPKDILSYIGQNYHETDMNGILYDVIDLLMTDKGYKINSENPDLVIKTADSKEKTDLSKLASEVLRILDVIDEELKQKEDKEKSLAKKPSSDFNSSFEYFLYRISSIPSE